MPCSITIRPLLHGCHILNLLLAAITYVHAADPPSTSPTLEPSTPVPDSVQERGFNRAPFGGSMANGSHEPKRPRGIFLRSQNTYLQLPQVNSR